MWATRRGHSSQGSRQATRAYPTVEHRHLFRSALPLVVPWPIHIVQHTSPASCVGLSWLPQSLHSRRRYLTRHDLSCRVHDIACANNGFSLSNPPALVLRPGNIVLADTWLFAAPEIYSGLQYFPRLHAVESAHFKECLKSVKNLRVKYVIPMILGSHLSFACC